MNIYIHMCVCVCVLYKACPCCHYTFRRSNEDVRRLQNILTQSEEEKGNLESEMDTMRENLEKQLTEKDDELRVMIEESKRLSATLEAHKKASEKAVREWRDKYKLLQEEVEERASQEFQSIKSFTSQMNGKTPEDIEKEVVA